MSHLIVQFLLIYVRSNNANFILLLLQQSQIFHFYIFVVLRYSVTSLFYFPASHVIYTKSESSLYNFYFVREIRREYSQILFCIAKIFNASQKYLRCNFHDSYHRSYLQKRIISACTKNLEYDGKLSIPITITYYHHLLRIFRIQYHRTR